METVELTRGQIHNFLRSLNGSFFSVDFIKRTTGELRTMRATTNYKSKLVGGVLKYDADEKKLIPVWDMDKKAFRSIPTDSVLVIRAKGAEIKVIEDKEVKA
jgi:hypothetical protein